MWRRGKTSFALAILQFLLLISFILKSYYGPDVDATESSNSYSSVSCVAGKRHRSIDAEFQGQYAASFFFSIWSERLSVMDSFFKLLLLAIGMSVTFVKNFTLCGVGFNLLTAAVVLQSSLVFRLLTDQSKIVIDIQNLMHSLEAVLAVVLSNLSLAGQISPLQQIFFSIVASLAYEINRCLTLGFSVSKRCSPVQNYDLYLQIHELFPCIRIIIFGSLFGVAASLLADKKRKLKIGLTDCANSQMIALGSIALSFCLWPVILVGTSVGDKQQRIIVNTILSQSTSIVTSFVAASLCDSRNRFDVVSRKRISVSKFWFQFECIDQRMVQIGSTAGAVSISAVAAFMLHPAGAMLIGIFGAIIAISSIRSVGVSTYFKFHSNEFDRRTKNRFHLISYSLSSWKKPSCLTTFMWSAATVSQDSFPQSSPSFIHGMLPNKATDWRFMPCFPEDLRKQIPVTLRKYCFQCHASDQATVSRLKDKHFYNWSVYSSHSSSRLLLGFWADLGSGANT